ncbi:hypothetical protein CPB86DRAFT_817118 [Serendipita vermifera]|nr:hypothetical protein CPB86DRAFT_817118 [Serendipita vermifera]
MAANDLLRLPERSGATHYLLCHIWGTSLIRQLSVTKDFNPGSNPLNYLQLTDETRSAVQYHINQLNRNSFDPRHAVWAVNSIYLLRGELVFVAENLTAIPRPKTKRGQCAPPFTLAGLLAPSVQVALACKAEEDPVLILHLAALPSDQYEVRSQLVVTEGFQPTDSVYPYFSVTKFWRKAIKTELQRLNNHSEDLREHAWALGSIHSILQGKPADVVGVVMVLHWMSCEPVENPVPLSHSPMIHSLRHSPSHEPERDL